MAKSSSALRTLSHSCDISQTTLIFLFLNWFNMDPLLVKTGEYHLQKPVVIGWFS